MHIYNKGSIVEFKKGSVILAGAGPGSLKQVTLKVYKSIQEADVIIYDALVNRIRGLEGPDPFELRRKLF